MTEQTSTPSQEAITELTAEIVAAYVAKNSVPAGELPSLISSIFATLNGIGNPASVEAPAEQKRQPAVSMRKSIHDDYLISLLDGKRYKSLKRHLAGNGFTPQTYREEFGLPHDYPMTAKSYSAKRSELARSIGLGRKSAEAAAAPAPVAQPEPELPLAVEAPKRGRKKAA